jgi:hypothetical protein
MLSLREINTYIEDCVLQRNSFNVESRSDSNHLDRLSLTNESRYRLLKFLNDSCGIIF